MIIYIYPITSEPSLTLETTRTPINNKISPINITPRPTGKQDTNPIQLTHSAHPARRIPTRPGIPRGLYIPVPSIENRVHITRRNTVDPNPMNSPLSSQTRFEGYDGRLTDIVSNLGLGEIDPMRGYRGREGDAVTARLLRRHLSRCRLRGKEGARGVDVQGLAP